MCRLIPVLRFGIAGLLLLFSPSATAQHSWYKGFSLEAGAAYNTLQWWADDHISDTMYKGYRRVFALQPVVRLSFTIPFRGDSGKFRLTPFAGYAVFGGKSTTDTSGYKDIISFHAIEAGILPEFGICKRFHLGAGLKANYILSVSQRHYGYANQAHSLPREWMRSDISFFYKTWSWNAGARVKFVFHRFTFATEAWFGLSNLRTIKSPFIDLRSTENNYRILLGYSF